MASEVQNKCGSDRDSVLSILSNTLSIFTFLYAVAVGGAFYVSLARRSSQRKIELLESLQKSLAEAHSFGDSVEDRDYQVPETANLKDELAQTMHDIAGQARYLGRLPFRDNRQGPTSWYGKLVRKLRLGLLEEEIEEGQSKTDRLMEDLRSIYSR